MKHEKHQHKMVQPTRHSNGGKLMIWGSMSYNDIGPVVMLPKKVNSCHYLEILNNVSLVDGERLINDQFILHQDNVSIHNPPIIRNYLCVVGQKWHPQSPVLNVIKYCWHYLKLKMSCQIERKRLEAIGRISKPHGARFLLIF